MTKIDISTLSRPYNVTIDTKWCIGYNGSGTDRYIFKVDYCGVEPELEFYKFDREGDPTNAFFYPQKKIDIMGLKFLVSEFYFLTEDEFFLEEI